MNICDENSEQKRKYWKVCIEVYNDSFQLEHLIRVLLPRHATRCDNFKKFKCNANKLMQRKEVRRKRNIKEKEKMKVEGSKKLYQ